MIVVTLGSVTAAAEESRLQRARQILGEARETAAHIENTSVRDQILCKIAKLQVRAGDLEGGLATNGQLSDDIQKWRCIYDFISTPVGDLSREAATVLLQRRQELEQLAQRNSEPGRTVALIAVAQARAGDVEGGRETLQRAIASSKNENEATILRGFRIASFRLAAGEALVENARALSVSGDFDGALKTARSIESRTKRTQALFDVAKQLAKSGRAKEAIDTALSVELQPTAVSTLLEIAEIHASAGDLDASREAFAAAKTAGNQYSIPNLAIAELAKVATIQKKVGEVTASKESFAEAVARASILPSPAKRGALMMIAAELTKAGELERALEIANSIEVISARRMLFLIVISLAEKEQFEKAEEVIAGLSDEELRDNAHARIAIMKATQKDVAGALKAAQQIKSPEERVQTIAEVSKRSNQTSAVTAISRALAEALETAKAVNGDKVQSELFSELAVAYANQGDSETALALLDQLGNAFVELTATRFEEMARLRTEAGHIKEVIGWIEKYSSSLNASSVRLGIAKSLLGIVE